MKRKEAIKHLSEWMDEKMWRCFGTIDREAIGMAIGALKEQTTLTIKLNNQIHLCDSCKYNYPNCPAENEDVLFGNGVGNDNICCCAKYLASADRPHGEWMIDTYNMELRCEICGENFRFDNVDELLDYKEYAKYCLACGARMI